MCVCVCVCVCVCARARASMCVRVRKGESDHTMVCMCVPVGLYLRQPDSCFIMPVSIISRVSSQNGVSRLYIIVEIYHSGRKPSTL